MQEQETSGGGSSGFNGAVAAVGGVNTTTSDSEGLWKGGLAVLQATKGGVSSSTGTEATSRFGSIPLQPGESTSPLSSSSEPYERPLSAPPPPGFGEGGQEERTRKASELIMRPVSSKEDAAAADQLRRPNNNNNSSNNNSNDNENNDRSNSFTNLAAVFGTGLAQSMEDATYEQNFSVDSMFNPQRHDLNFHRQSRHAASRLLARGIHSNAEKEGFSAAAAAAAPTGAAAATTTTTTAYAGFPSSLSSPQKREEALRVQMFPGQLLSTQQRNAFPSSNKDIIGTHVSEPDEENEFTKYEPSRVISQRIDIPEQDAAMAELERGLSSLLSSTAREFKPHAGMVDSNNGQQQQHSIMSATSSVSDSMGDNASDLTSRKAESELQSYTWSPAAADGSSSSSSSSSTTVISRTIVILHVSYLRVPDVRSACEAFGVIETFRADFASRGIYFVSYYDIRSAQYAVTELQPILQRQSVMQRSSEEVVVKYCISLNSSSQFDESRILISELPAEICEYHVLRSMLSSYGSVRSVVPQQEMGTFLVEFHNTQDAKQAQLELDSSQPFGPDAFVEVAMRSSSERRKGRELLTMMSRWRQGLTRQIGSQPTESRRYPVSAPPPVPDPWQSSSQPSYMMPGQTEILGMGGTSYGLGAGAGQGGQFHQREAAATATTTTQLMLGPDGRYTPVVVQNQMPISSFPPTSGTPIEQQQQQQIIRGPNGEMYLTTTTVPASQQSGQYFLGRDTSAGFPTTIVTSSGGIPDSQQRRPPQTRTPYYTHLVSDAGSLSGLSGRSHRSSAYSTSTDAVVEKDTRHLMLDLDAVENGRDTRTSLMVRNIPNKYTQQMLLSEFEENGHGPGVIDFFYLPIDFKNRCNRGYAFINFVDYRDILAFHQLYFGKHWRTFNSDKICDITYARIQGKAAMLKRFENSALMEKDDEYKPLVFMSDGPDKGKRLPFPHPSTKAS